MVILMMILDVGLAGPNFSEEKVEGSDYSTKHSFEFEVELVGDNDDSDVQEEVRELMAEKRSFQRKKKGSVAIDNEEVLVGDAGPDLGFDETEKSKVKHKGRQVMSLHLQVLMRIILS